MNSRQNTLRLGVAALALVAATEFAAAQKPATDKAQLTNVQLSAEQRKQVRSALIERRNAWRVSSVDFDLTVGAVVPRGQIQVVPVPNVLLQINPEWRGFLYFVHDGEVVVVDPDNMRIVAIVAP